MTTTLVRALYHLAAEWHSGQWSRGYRLLCRVQRYARRHGIAVERQTRASRRLSRQLAGRYAGKL